MFLLSTIWRARAFAKPLPRDSSSSISTNINHCCYPVIQINKKRLKAPGKERNLLAWQTRRLSHSLNFCFTPMFESELAPRVICAAEWPPSKKMYSFTVECAITRYCAKQDLTWPWDQTNCCRTKIPAGEQQGEKAPVFLSSLEVSFLDGFWLVPVGSKIPD